MRNYSRFHRDKLKTSKALTDAYKHNERIYPVANADPFLKDQNIELISTNGKSYEELFQETISNLSISGVPGRKIRSDAVKGYELVLGFSREQSERIDLKVWAEQSLKWVDRMFNPPDHTASFMDKHTGEEKTIPVQNIKHAVLHMDESSPHIHAFIVPINQNGRLCAYDYYHGRDGLIELQTSYAKEMEQFGLKRGEPHSIATREDISRYHSHINRAVHASLPEPFPQETISEYKVRAEAVYQTASIVHRNEIVKKDQEIVRAYSEAKQSQLELKKCEKKIESLEQELGGELTDDMIEELIRAIHIRKISKDYPNKDKLTELQSIVNDMEQWNLVKKQLEYSL